LALLLCERSRPANLNWLIKRAEALAQERNVNSCRSENLRNLESSVAQARSEKNSSHRQNKIGKFLCKAPENYCFAKINHLQTTNTTDCPISNTVKTALKTPADNSPTHERRSLISMRTVSFSPLPEAPCPFCMHRKCTKCREVSFSVAACCECRKRALARLDCLQKSFCEGKRNE